MKHIFNSFTPIILQFPYEERIDGSNPSTPIIYRDVAEEIRRRTSNPQIVGSSPTVPIIINQGGVA